jgi:hypothetical protein
MAPFATVQRAQLLLLVDRHPKWSDAALAQELGCHLNTVRQWRQRWQVTDSLCDSPRAGRRRTFTPLQRTRVIALACSAPRQYGKPWQRWSGEKLARVAIEQQIVERIAPSTIRTWLPATAQALAYHLQQGTAREAELAAQQVGRLPYSRSSFESIGHEVGRQYTAVQTEVEESLIEAYVVPPDAASVSVALDRVSVPMEEAEAEAEGGPKLETCQRKVWRQFRMASCATLTLHDGKGEALHTIRYGRMPQGDVAALCRTLTHDVCILVRKQPGLGVILLADGAAELWKLLTTHLNAETLGVPVRQ